MNADDQPKSLCHGCRWLGLLSAVVFIVAWASGFVTNSLMNRERVRADGQRRFEEFLSIADSFGIIDHARLDEVVCIASEAEWEDVDAAERQGEGQ